MRKDHCARVSFLTGNLLAWLGGGIRPFSRLHISARKVSKVMSCMALVLCHCASAPAYTALVAFGDSYTDTGRTPSSPPNYWNGRFSNGPLWIEYLSQTLGFTYDPENNFAVSGSEANELGVQINNFGGTSDSANVLFAIWSGNNDFGNHLNIGYNDAAWDTQINSVITSLTTSSDLLYQKGARSIMLFNLIDLTRVPYILNNYSATFRTYVETKIQIFNQRLAQAVPGLLNSHPGLQVFLIDIHTDLGYLLNTYSTHGFTQATVDALDDPNLSDTSFTGPGANYVFWDSQHPTTKTHGLLAKWIANVLPVQPPPPPPSISITTPQNGTQFTAPARIPIDAAIDSNGWSISQVSFFQNGVLVGQVSSPPYTFVLSSGVDGQSTLSVQAAYGAGQTVQATPIQVVVTAPTGSPPPLPWNHSDIGNVGQPGNTTYSSDGTFTISGSGSDIWGAADAFQYNYQVWRGDGTIIGRVTSIQESDGYAKAGLMFRESLSPGAANVMVFMDASFLVDFQNRQISGGVSSYIPGISNAPPCWLKLQRSGNTFSGYGSPDGINWAFLGSVSIPMTQIVYVGLAVTAHNNALLNSATFDNVQLVQPRRPVPPALHPRPAAVRSVSFLTPLRPGAIITSSLSPNPKLEIRRPKPESKG
jgi:phospholipase/lecithinase/hemolysin